MILRTAIRWRSVPLWVVMLLAFGGCDTGTTNPPPPRTVSRQTAPAEKGPAEAPASREVRIAAASDLKFALADVIAAFESANPAIHLVPTYGSSGNFYSQLSNKAPFDVFLSADMDFPRKLIEQGQALKDSEFLYAIGHLVVWVRNESVLDLKRDGIKVLTDPSVMKVSIANPRHAPYGRAAEAALKKLGVYEAIEAKLVLGDNVLQAAQFVESGAADVGVFALSLALSKELSEKGRYWQVPLDAYPRLEQGGVILSWAQDEGAAREFCRFLGGTEARKILDRYGFLLPGE